MDHLEEIKSRLSIEELVGTYVQLKKAGRNLRGLCPFHNEKTPSFMVSPEKQIAYCFGCQQGGDIFKFTQIVENCEFGEAVKLLADKTHVKLPKSNPGWQNKRLSTLEINKAAIAFFKENLTNEVRAYLNERGLSDETIAAFELGYSPDQFHALRETLSTQGFSQSALLESGLLNQRSLADKTAYDRFRNRLMFPIFDHQGNPIAFGGRIMGEGQPKYLNSPDSPAYNKSLVLYGLDRAKKAIKEADMAIVVEGYMDVIAAHQAGSRNAIATSGTALTPQQIKLLKRYTPNIAFAFDQDQAGMQATLRAIELAQMAEVNVYVIMLPHGKDPDECIKDNSDAWQKAVSQPVSAMDFYFEYAKRQYDANDLQGRKQILNLLLPLIKKISTETEQSHFLKRLSLDLKTDIQYLWNDLKKLNLRQVPSYGTGTPSSIATQTKTHFSREIFLLGFIFQYPELYAYVMENLIDGIPFDSEVERFYNACKIVYKKEHLLTLDELKKELAPEDHEKLDIYRLLIDEHYPDFSESAAEKEVRGLVTSINRSNLKRIQKEYEFKIRSATGVGNQKLLLNQYNEILKLASKLN